MASTADSRDCSYSCKDEDRMAKRRAKSQWVPTRDVPQYYDGPGNSQKMWMAPSQPSSMAIPPVMGMVPMPPFPTVMMPMMKNGETFNAQVEQPFMVNVGGHNQHTMSPSHLATDEKPHVPATDAGHLDVLGTYPVDIHELKAHIAYENELFYDMHNRIKESGHFSDICTLIENYFKEALSVTARAKITDKLQAVIDDKDTSLEEAKRLKNILESIRNSANSIPRGKSADPIYLELLSSVYDSYLAEMSASREVK